MTWHHGHARVHIGVISPEYEAVVDNPKQSPGQVLDDVIDRGDWRASVTSPVPIRVARVPSQAAIVGLTVMALVVAGVWMAVGAAWSTVAGESRTDASPLWPGIVYGAGSLTSALALSRPGIVHIPRNLRQVELPANLRATIVIFLLLLQFIGEVLLPRLPGL